MAFYDINGNSIIAPGMNEVAKNLLVTLLANSPYTREQGTNIVKLAKELDVDVNPEYTCWDYELADIIIYPGKGLYTNMLSTTPFRAISVQGHGDVAYSNSETILGDGVRAYPIEIPIGASNVTVIAKSASGNADIAVFLYSVTSDGITQLAEDGFGSYGVKMVDLTQYENATHIAVMYRVSNSFVLDETYDFSQYSITFNQGVTE